MNVTSIEWTTFSANPLKYRDEAGKTVWACVHASPGCKFCYAETRAKRYGKGGPFNVPTTAKVTPFLDELELRKMLGAQTIGGIRVAGSRCFVGDMTDLFGDWVPDAFLVRLFAVFALRPDVTWQVLTKRAKRMRDLIGLWRPVSGPPPFSQRILAAAHEISGREVEELPWPLPNVWLGVSCEDQQRADERIPHLLQTPAAVRFVSAEPLIGAMDLRLRGGFCRACKQWTKGSIAGHCLDPRSACFAGEMAVADGIDWVIVGGESGPGARPCEERWIRDILQDCRDTGVACFVKQVGSVPIAVAYRGSYHEWKKEKFGDDWRVKLVDGKGGEPSEWPKGLRVRQFPEARA